MNSELRAIQEVMATEPCPEKKTCAIDDGDDKICIFLVPSDYCVYFVCVCVAYFGFTELVGGRVFV